MAKRRYVSHSSLDAYGQCPKKWQLRYVEQVEEKPMLAGVAGNAVHKATEIIDNDELWKDAGDEA